VTDTRKLVALIIAVMAFGVIVFGVALGVSSSGPAQGTRLLVSVQKPVSEVAVGQAVQAARTELPTAGRIIGGQDGIVVEIASQDPKDIAETTRKLETDPRLHVDRSDAFTRATGFWGRAWLFLAIAGVMLAGAAVLARKR
jgi:hypothetical protein